MFVFASSRCSTEQGQGGSKADGPGSSSSPRAGLLQEKSGPGPTQLPREGSQGGQNFKCFRVILFYFNISGGKKLVSRVV